MCHELRRIDLTLNWYMYMLLISSRLKILCSAVLFTKPMDYTQSLVDFLAGFVAVNSCILVGTGSCWRLLIAIFGFYYLSLLYFTILSFEKPLEQCFVFLLQTLFYFRCNLCLNSKWFLCIRMNFSFAKHLVMRSFSMDVTVLPLA